MVEQQQQQQQQQEEGPHQVQQQQKQQRVDVHLSSLSSRAALDPFALPLPADAGAALDPGLPAFLAVVAAVALLRQDELPDFGSGGFRAVEGAFAMPGRRQCCA